MDWGISNAKYELLVCDSPLIVYDHKKDNGGRDKTPTKKDMDDLVRKWEAKKAEDETKGIKVSLNDFINNGVEALKTAQK